MLLICSPELEESDIDAITLGYAKKSTILIERLVAQIDLLLAEDATSLQTRLLATLVASGSLDIKLAFRADRKGLYHEKIGIFIDGLGHRVSFKGSANETWSAWDPSGNFESIEVFCSWRGGLEAERVAKHETHFDRLWSEKDEDIEVFAFPSEALIHLKRAAYKDLGSVTPTQTPTSEARRTPLPHQVAAIAGWDAQGRRGILQHATGSGKTFTAIVAISRHVESGLPALVLVPSDLLLQQWAAELRQEIPNAALLLAGGGNVDWKKLGRLRSMSDPDHTLGPRVILATMQTASTDDFISRLSEGEHLMLVADEVHQSGSPQNSRLYQISTGPRLGLSATPTRFGDPDGTAMMFEYFGAIVPPTITLNDAIEAGRLVPYEYFPHPVHLNATEAADWSELTRSIQLEMARQKSEENGRRPLSERAKMLLIRRARIAKKASSKTALANRILTEHYQVGQSWLVYCEDSEQLTVVMDDLRRSGLKAIEFHSSMSGDKEATLAWFRRFGGILVSIRCLDEGVDIPTISHALILASSQNPRQFIQRRGRVLRRSQDKDVAVIHDAIVVPLDAEQETDQMGLLKAELLRSIEFSEHALNRSGSAELRAIAISMGLDPDTLTEAGIEGDDT